MNEVATELLKDALEAYAQRDDERDREVWMRDTELGRAGGFGLP
jgi:phosphate transport system protein